MPIHKYRAAVASAGKGPVYGTIGEDIIVLPDMSSQHVDAVMNANGAIAETGGPLTHLAIVSRSAECVLMIMPNAASILRPGMRVILTPRLCEISVIE